MEQSPSHTPRTEEQLEQDMIEARRYKQRKAILKHIERSTRERVDAFLLSMPMAQ